MLRPVFLRIANIALWGWTATKFALDWIGRSTVVEDFRSLMEKLPGFVEFLYRMPWPVPAGLATIVTGVLLYPDLRELFSKPKQSAITSASADAEVVENSDSATEIDRKTETPFGGALLGDPIGGVYRPEISRAPPRVDPETEHASKKAAKEALVLLSREFFNPAWTAMHTLKCEARDQFALMFNKKGPVRNLIVRAVDLWPQKPETRKDFANFHQLQDVDTMRRLNLHEAETAVYHAYIDYGQSLELAVGMLNECDSMHESIVKKFRDQYSTWHDAHQKFVARQIELSKEHLDLSTVGRLHIQVLKEIPSADWDRLTIPAK